MEVVLMKIIDTLVLKLKIYTYWCKVEERVAKNGIVPENKHE